MRQERPTIETNWTPFYEAVQDRTYESVSHGLTQEPVNQALHKEVQLLRSKVRISALAGLTLYADSDHRPDNPQINTFKEGEVLFILDQFEEDMKIHLRNKVKKLTEDELFIHIHTNFRALDQLVPENQDESYFVQALYQNVDYYRQQFKEYQEELVLKKLYEEWGEVPIVPVLNPPSKDKKQRTIKNKSLRHALEPICVAVATVLLATKGLHDEKNASSRKPLDYAPSRPITREVQEKRDPILDLAKKESKKRNHSSLEDTQKVPSVAAPIPKATTPIREKTAEPLPSIENIEDLRLRGFDFQEQFEITYPHSLIERINYDDINTFTITPMPQNGKSINPEDNEKIQDWQTYPNHAFVYQTNSPQAILINGHTFRGDYTGDGKQDHLLLNAIRLCQLKETCIGEIIKLEQNGIQLNGIIKNYIVIPAEQYHGLQGYPTPFRLLDGQAPIILDLELLGLPTKYDKPTIIFAGCTGSLLFDNPLAATHRVLAIVEIVNEDS